MSDRLFAHMKSNIKLISSLFVSFAIMQSTSIASEAEEKIIRSEIRASGFVAANKLYKNPDENLSHVGRIFFESNKGLSLNGNISCRTCHQDKFGSADGIPNAAAIGGGDGKKFVGPERLLNGAKQLPRNTLAFWGRGAKEFDVFFWDGKIDFSQNPKVSQFGTNPPSDDALITAVHLPVVEIREMLEEDEFILSHKLESNNSAKEVYEAISKRLQQFEPEGSLELARLLNKPKENLQFIDYARAIASFIRSDFRIQKTKLEQFVDETSKFDEGELRGALLFYGKGRCVTCHYGPHFSDFKFHVVAFPQLGFGKNGFGQDYGRYNVTFNPEDQYKFRTPPLYNVEKTAPYGHSGSVATMKEAVIAHFDPLSLVQIDKLDGLQRNEYTKKLTLNETVNRISYLNDQEVDAIVSFLKTLSFNK